MGGGISAASDAAAPSAATAPMAAACEVLTLLARLSR